MPLAQNGRGIRGLVWTDSDGQPHTILLAYLGDKVVWDGHIHETIQVPAMAGVSTLPVPVVGSASLVEVPLLSTLADLPAPALVGGGVTISPDGLSVDVVALAPVLHSDHTLDVDVATMAGELLPPDVRVVFGVTPPPMTAASVLLEPSVFADATVSPPEMVAFVEVRNPDVGSWAIIEPPVMAASVVGQTPGVAASSRVDGEVAAGTALHPVPTLAAGSTVAAATSSATAGMQVPEVLTSGPEFVTANSVGAKTNSGSVSITTTAVTTVFAAHNSSAAPTSITIGGVAGTVVGSVTTSSRTLTLYRWDGIAAGSRTVSVSGGGWFSLSVAAYEGVNAVSSPVTATGTTAASVSGTTTDIILSAFGGANTLTATSGTGRAGNWNGDDASSALLDSPGGSAANAATNGLRSVTVKIT